MLLLPSHVAGRTKVNFIHHKVWYLSLKQRMSISK